MTESGVTFDCGQFVMDNEFARLIKHTVGGIRVDDESLAVDDIHAVGAFGDFLSLDATLKHMREQSSAGLLDRRVREEWQERGATDLYTRCLDEARHALREYRPTPVPADIAAEMHRIVQEADREAGVA